MSSLRFCAQGEAIRAVESEIHKSLDMLVKESDLLDCILQSQIDKEG